MKCLSTAIALAGLATCAVLPAAAQTAITMEAEGMTLSSYVVEDRLIKLAIWSSPGSATQRFGGASGTYDIAVHVLAESDGQSTLEVFKGSTLLHRYVYPLQDGLTSFTISGVALATDETIELVGRYGQGALARVDKIVFTPAASQPVAAAPAPRTGPVGALARVARKVMDELMALKRAASPPDTGCANPAGGYEGFGRDTTGGAGKPVYRVTNLNDRGAGSLREALSQGNRCVVFEVGGTISLASNLLVTGSNVTIDGLTAPAPGITLRNNTLVIQGSSGAGNVVVRGIRHRGTGAGMDGMRVYQASNVVFDRVSVSGFGDGALDVTESSRNVTIQWSILGNGDPAHNFPSLIKYDTSRVTVHHNLYIGGDYRNPYCAHSDLATSLPSEIVCDVRNNLIWNYGNHGTEIATYGAGNVVNNYYYTQRSVATAAKSVYVATGGSAYVSGNYSKNGWDVNSSGNRATPYACVEPITTDAVTAARQVVAQAGARGSRFGLDSTDQGYLGQVSITN